MAAIRTEALRRQFGEFVAVRDVTLEVSDGQTFGLLGPNGAGKSTLIRMLTTLLEPTSGTALVAGHDVRKEPNAVRRTIGVIPQALTSDPDLTAAENLDFQGKLYDVPRTARRRLVEALLESVDLLQWRDKLVGTFSGGMRRRLEIARSLMHEPRILFLDEPTTGLDPTSRMAMWDMLRRLKEQTGLTVFLTTHYMDEADQLCDRVAICDHGAIIALDTPQRLKNLVTGHEIIEARFEHAPPDWRDQVASLPGVWRVDATNGSCRIESDDRRRTLQALLELARLHAVPISSFSVKGTTLDDVFITYTGRNLRDVTDAHVSRDYVHLYERKPHR